MAWLVPWIDRKFYPQFGDRWDNRLLRNVTLPLVEQAEVVLDLGAGRGANDDLDFSDTGARVVGVDPDKAVLENPYLDEAKVQSPPDYKIPYDEGLFDVVVSNNLIEHVQDMDGYLREIHRVLKPGGHFVAKTPNKGHYVPRLARLTPHWFHEFYNSLRGREAHDSFPTTYPCNSRSEIQTAASANEFDVVDIQVLEGRPEYLRLNALMYLGGLAYERLVNSSKLFERFRCVIILHLQKPPQPDG